MCVLSVDVFVHFFLPRKLTNIPTVPHSEIGCYIASRVDCMCVCACVCLRVFLLLILHTGVVLAACHSNPLTLCREGTVKHTFSVAYGSLCVGISGITVC